MMAEGLEVENDRLVGFVNLAYDRMNDIVNMTMNQEEEMQQLRSYFKDELSRLPALQAMVTVLPCAQDRAVCDDHKGRKRTPDRS